MWFLGVSGLILFLLSLVTPGSPEMRAECMVWAKLENKTLPLQNQGQAKCLTNKECSGFTCTGVYQDKDLTFGMRVLPCRKVPGVEIYGYAPQFHAQNFSHIFTHKSQYVVPGALLNMSVIPGNISPSKFGELTGKIEVHLERNALNNTLILGLSAMACINDTCPFRKLVFNHTEIPVLSCPKTSFEEDSSFSTPEDSAPLEPRCDVNEVLTCGPNRVCVRTDPSSPGGLCKCRSGYSLDSRNQDCISRQPKTLDGAPSKGDEAYIDPETVNVFESHTPSLKEPVPSPSNVPQSEEPLNGALVGGIVAGVLSGCILLVLLVVFLISLTRLAPRLRARITRRPYEDIIIGESPNSKNVIQGVASP